MAKIRQIGNSAGVIIPAAVLAAAGMREDDNVRVTSTPQGILIEHAPQESAAVKAGLAFMSKHKKAFERLARK